MGFLSMIVREECRGRYGTGGGGAHGSLVVGAENLGLDNQGCLVYGIVWLCEVRPDQRRSGCPHACTHQTGFNLSWLL